MEQHNTEHPRLELSSQLVTIMTTEHCNLRIALSRSIPLGARAFGNVPPCKRIALPAPEWVFRERANALEGDARARGLLECTIRITKWVREPSFLTNNNYRSFLYLCSF